MHYQKRIQKILSRLKGFSLSLFGISWEPQEQEIELVAPLITYLENKRVIFDFRDDDYRLIGHGVAEYPYFKASVFDIRSRIEITLEQVERDSDLFRLLRNLHQACNDFLHCDQTYENFKYENGKAPESDQTYEKNEGAIREVYLAAVDFRRSFLINIFRVSVAYDIPLYPEHERYLSDLVNKVNSASDIKHI